MDDDSSPTDAVDSPEPPVAKSAEVAEETKPDGPSFGGLADTIRRRTSDLLAIGILVVAALSFGREITGWWDADEPAPVAATEHAFGSSKPGWDVPGRRVELRFGESGLHLHRERIVGDADVAIEQLLVHCATLLSDRELPTDAVDPGEERMLAATTDLEPVRRGDGWAIHVVATPMPTAIGVLGDDSACTTCGGRRAVCWGVLMGADEPGTWTAFWFDRRPTDDESTTTEFTDVVLPTGAKRTMSLRDVTGAGVIGFEGRGDADEWVRSFDEAHPPDDGWTTNGWRTLGVVRTVRYDHAESGRTVEVRIETGGSALVGLVAVDIRVGLEGVGRTGSER